MQHSQFGIRTMMLLLLLSAAGHVMGRVISVSTASAINKTWSAGDTLVMPNGIYSNLSLTIQGTGTASEPIVLCAAKPGMVFLEGSSNVTLKGKYIEVNGLRFSGTYSGKNHIVQFDASSSYCRLTECAIEDYNPTDATKDLKWISLKGKQNRVDHCYFVQKTNMGTLLVVWLEENVIPQHRIDHNYFGTRVANTDGDGKALNGQEIIRIGDSSTSMQEAQCTVERNYFEHCDGEIEMISNKSCGNIYRNNTVYGCAGTLTFRHGNGCTAEENWFFGEGVTSSGGVRIIGENHVVKNNYFQDLTGNNFRAAVSIVRGKPNSALNEYFQVKNAEVKDNIFVNCKEAFCVNYHTSSDCNLLVENTTISNNTVYNDDSHTSCRVVTQATSGGTITWEGNIYKAGKFSGYTASSPAWKKKSSMSQPTVPSDIPSASNSGPAWLHPTTPTENVTVEPDEKQAIKILQNGRLYIRYNGTMYYVQGGKIIDN